MQEEEQNFSRESSSLVVDIAVVGAGAAGFFAAITAKQMQPQARVSLFERGNHPLKKVGLTGGGRCNLTNSFAAVTDLKQVYPRGHQLLKRLFKSFNHEDAMAWFQKAGVPLVTQADHCVFPQSQDAQTIVETLMKEAERMGVELHYRHTFTGLSPMDDGHLSLAFREAKSVICRQTIITTGGSPTQKGLEPFLKMQHQIEEPVPSLFTFALNEPALTQLMGAVIPHVRLSIPATKLCSAGILLITHWGVSGPATLKLSSYAARFLHERHYHCPISINWTGKTNQQKVAEDLLHQQRLHPQKQMSTTKVFELPTRVWHYLLQRSTLNPETRWCDLSKKALHKLVEVLTNDGYLVEGKGTFKEEFVTCGGVSLQSIHANTLESKVIPGLYFAGEILDVDGITGGFNLQAAWTTGYVAGKSVARTFGRESEH